MNKKITTIRIDQDLHKKIMHYVIENDLSFNDLIIQLLKDFFRKD